MALVGHCHAQLTPIPFSTHERFTIRVVATHTVKHCSISTAPARPGFKPPSTPTSNLVAPSTTTLHDLVAPKTLIANPLRSTGSGDNTSWTALHELSQTAHASKTYYDAPLQTLSSRTLSVRQRTSATRTDDYETQIVVPCKHLLACGVPSKTIIGFPPQLTTSPRRICVAYGMSYCVIRCC